VSTKKDSASIVDIVWTIALLSNLCHMLMLIDLFGTMYLYEEYHGPNFLQDHQELTFYFEPSLLVFWLHTQPKPFDCLQIQSPKFGCIYKDLELIDLIHETYQL